MIDALIFDVDGTIWDSTEEVAASWRITCKKEGIPCDFLTGTRMKSEFGKLLEDIGRSIFPDMPEDKMQDILHKCCEYENEYLLQSGPKAYPGVEEMMSTLSKKMPLYIVSNCQSGYIEAMLFRTGLTPYISDHLCPGDTGLDKAGNIVEMVRRHHLKAPYYVGDTAGDQASCKKAGVPFIHASYGFGEVTDPDGSISKPEDLINLVLKMR